MEEKCKYCKHCKELYIPPTMKTKAQYILCCTLFFDEDSIMFLDDDNGRCECFKRKEVVEWRD